MTSNPSFGANALEQITFDGLRLAEVDVLGEKSSVAPLTLNNYAPGTTQASFTLRRTAVGSLMGRFTVTDDCGPWSTFVGVGPGSGW
jgi:hypothetical protein